MNNYNTQKYDGLAISGPSGIGKTFLAKHLQQRFGFQLVVSTTTRPIRNEDGEQQGVDYNFISENSYKSIETRNGLLISNYFFGSWYGFETCAFTQAKKQGAIPSAVIFTPTIPQVLREYPNILSVYLYPEPGSLEFLRNRMLIRGDSPERIVKRMNGIEQEIGYYLAGYHDYYNYSFMIGKDSDIIPVVQTIIREFGI